MKKIFWDNPYQRELTTTVVQVNGNHVVFAETSLLFCRRARK